MPALMRDLSEESAVEVDGAPSGWAPLGAVGEAIAAPDAQGMTHHFVIATFRRV